jgi:hypothetical protein
MVVSSRVVEGDICASHYIRFTFCGKALTQAAVGWASALKGGEAKWFAGRYKYKANILFHYHIPHFLIYFAQSDLVSSLCRPETVINHKMVPRFNL